MSRVLHPARHLSLILCLFIAMIAPSNAMAEEDTLPDPELGCNDIRCVYDISSGDDDAGSGGTY